MHETTPSQPPRRDLPDASQASAEHLTARIVDVDRVNPADCGFAHVPYPLPGVLDQRRHRESLAVCLVGGRPSSCDGLDF
ncbi:MAG TPA: hypothetical protein VJV79_40225 [Polyangiaceae bacterium]|nr:hypothetical protein [Polyangiaceae bacterium]